MFTSVICEPRSITVSLLLSFILSVALDSCFPLSPSLRKKKSKKPAKRLMRLNARFYALSIQQKCHCALQICAVGFNAIDLQPIQHNFSRMSERVLISRRDHGKMRLNRSQER